MLSFDNLHDYQCDAIEWIDYQERGFVWLGTGDGKTVIGAAAARNFLATHPDGKVLVIGTKRIIENVWATELAKWSELSSLSYSAATGPKRKREKAVESNPDILGVSYENFVWYLTKTTDRRSFWIYDEISKMKSPSTSRFRTLGRASTKTRLPDKAIGLTATPSMEGHGGLFAQWRSVGGDDRLGRNVTEFRQLFTRPVFKGVFTDYVIDKPAARRIESLLEDSIFVIPENARPYLGVAEMQDVSIPWGTTGARDHYVRMEDQLIAELESGSFVAANKGVAMSKCKQLATGFIYDEEKVAHVIDTAKYDAVQEAYDELQGDPVLVFYQFEAEKMELLRRLKGSEPLTDNYDAFCRGEIPALVMHPLSCSHGLNLQNARYIFWSTLPTSGEQYAQANARINRQGQTRQPIIKRFLRTGTIDEWSVDLLEGKIADDTALIERIRSGRK